MTVLVIIGISAGVGLMILALVLWRKKTPNKKEAVDSEQIIEMDQHQELDPEVQSTLEPEPLEWGEETMAWSEEPIPRSEESLPRTEEPMLRSEEHLPRSEEPIPWNEEPLARSEKPIPRTEEPLTQSEKPMPRSKKTILRNKKTTPRVEEPILQAEKTILEPESVSRQEQMNEKRKISQQPLNVAEIMEQNLAKTSDLSDEEIDEPGLPYNVGKSGRVYTKKELELLIKE